MEARVERFLKAVAAYFGGRPGRGARYPEDLRQEARILARLGMLAGQSLGSVASELGVGCATLARWLEGAREALRPVEVEPEVEPPCPPFLVLVAPSGWRIEGLRREDIPELLRVLE
jgi:transposase-like protein